MAASTLRRGISTLSGGLSTDLTVLWRHGDTPLAVSAALHDVLPALIDQYGLAAAALAANWYDDLRDRRGIGGTFTAAPADVPDVGAHALVGWAAATAADYPSFQTLIAGGAQRRVANFARLTVMDSSVTDPKARGWMRVGDGNTCEFCAMLLGRGAVYSEASADFAAHDHCGCVAVPAF